MWKPMLIVTGAVAALALTAGAVAIAATSGHGSASSQNTVTAVQADTVIIKDDSFQPPVIQVQPGTTVTWVNQDDEAHNVVAADGSWQSPTLQQGEQFTHTFSAGESTRYLCTLHAWMVGVVQVGDQPAPAATPGAAWQNMWQHMQQLNPQALQAMREHMDAIWGQGSFDNMLQRMQNGQPCPFAGTGGNGPNGTSDGDAGGYGPGGMMGGTNGGYGPGGMMGGANGGYGPGGMMGSGAGGMMGR